MNYDDKIRSIQFSGTVIMCVVNYIFYYLTVFEENKKYI